MHLNFITTMNKKFLNGEATNEVKLPSDVIWNKWQCLCNYRVAEIKVIN